MAVDMRMLGLLLVVAMGTGSQQPPSMSNTLMDLAEIQKDLYMRTVQFFNASVSQELGKFISHLQALEARLDDVEKRLEDYAALIGNQNESPKLEPKPEPEVNSEPEPEPTTTTRQLTTRRATTNPITTQAPTTMTLPKTTQPTTTPMVTPTTCAELARGGQTMSGTYLIDPMQNGESFYVECEFPAGVTSVSHNVMNQEVINNGFEEPASFSLNPEYGASIEQLKALTAASQNCSQFIKYRCRGAVLLAEDKKTGQQYGYWVSVDGEPIISWGGSPVNSRKCACAFTGTGCIGGKGCNCDSNTKSFAIDEGLLTDKPYLPVVNVRLGDTGSKKETGYVTLGPLRCQ